jgi:hypothetical protein
LLKLRSHHNGNRQIQGVALLEEEVSELTEPTLSNNKKRSGMFTPSIKKAPV